MHKKYKYGFALQRIYSDEHNEWSNYPVVFLSRREWISFCYRMKLAVTTNEYRVLIKGPLGSTIITGDVPKADKRYLSYTEKVMAAILIRYWRTELHTNLSRELPSAKYTKKCMEGIEFWSKVYGALM